MVFLDLHKQAISSGEDTGLPNFQSWLQGKRAKEVSRTVVSQALNIGRQLAGLVLTVHTLARSTRLFKL